ncbi:MAG: response regulator transcription factor, partial [Nitrospirota bacterium]
MKILIVDDHDIVRERLKEILLDVSDNIVSAKLIYGKDVLKEVIKNNYDLVILDIATADGRGLNILKEIKNRRPELPVLVLGMYPEEQYAYWLIKAGASGYLAKEKVPEELMKAIQEISRGRKYVSPAISGKLP